MFCLVDLYVDRKRMDKFILYRSSDIDAFRFSLTLIDLDSFKEVSFNNIYALFDFLNNNEVVGIYHDKIFRDTIFSSCSRKACRLFNSFDIISYEDISDLFSSTDEVECMYDMYPEDSEYEEFIDYIADHTDERIIPLRINSINTWYNWHTNNIIKLFDTRLEMFRKMSTDEFSFMLIEGDHTFFMVRVRFKNRKGFDTLLTKLAMFGY